MSEPRPGVELLWGAPRTPARGPRPGLSLERIVGEAVAIADAAGVAGLTMPGLARRLDAGTMSLYRYIPGKDDLISLMIETATGDAPRLDVSDGWRPALTHWAHATRTVLLAHPWMLDVVTSPRVMGPRELGWLEEGLRALSVLALPPMRRFDLALLVNGYVRGVALEQVHGEAVAAQGPFFTPELLTEHGREADFPLLMEVMESFPFDAPAGDGEDARFAFGLERLLDGIETHFGGAAV
ncbi:TetR/AcrR family transcriptional regulator [Phytomonospora endophytica]|uniref:AcrR family transcriptional regulator n=1 Tax=Phytomonospora endophytica TaxID=714109 RepID=A0A841FPX2_9ACTN|nr:TetR/AcrR family transcriptional regulator C-terminal domain-containing protein [Phytomonospora endophytica]MBB6035317.1 AcrR family transcriptional regulator [Phytomonospora endophytica]GIG63934.1 TetR family transcriptional regulator [Phytomonospora endophytica]